MCPHKHPGGEQCNNEQAGAEGHLGERQHKRTCSSMRITSSASALSSKLTDVTESANESCAAPGDGDRAARGGVGVSFPVPPRFHHHSMHVCMHVCRHVCIHATCVRACVRVRVRVCVHTHTHTHIKCGKERILAYKYGWLRCTHQTCRHRNGQRIPAGEGERWRCRPVPPRPPAPSLRARGGESSVNDEAPTRSSTCSRLRSQTPHALAYTIAY